MKASNSSAEDDIFDSLHENAWSLPTADGKASLYVTSLGTGRSVVVLHGGPGDSFNYLVKAIRPHIAANRFVLFDQRGSLFSPISDTDVAELTVNALVEDLETLRQALGEEKVALFGHSFGTVLALSYYQAYPSHVAGLILSASFLPYTTPEKSFTDVVQETWANQEQLRERPKVKAELQKTGVADDKGLTPQQESIRRKILWKAALSLYHVEKWRECYVFHNRKVEDAVGNSMPEHFDIRPTFERNPISINVIQGDHDYLDPSAKSWQQLAEENHLVQIAVINEAGHDSWIDNPTDFQRQFAHSLALMR